MRHVGEPSAEVVFRPALEQELQMIREAIAMVAMGGAPRVSIMGIQFGRALLDPARRLALESGVRVRPLWRPDESGVDVAIERLAD